MTHAHAWTPGGLPGRHWKGPRGPFAHAMGGHRGHGPGRHGHGHGGPPWAGQGGFGGPGGRRRRMRRGDVRAALLLLLFEQPYNGYGLMQEIEQRSEGAWRPSPGSVYPALALLEDEGLVSSEPEGSGKRFTLTDAGRAHVEERRAQLGEPWSDAGEAGGSGRGELRGLVWQLGSAAMQVSAAGTEEQVERAKVVLKDARRALYRLLAEDEDDAPEG